MSKTFAELVSDARALSAFIAEERSDEMFHHHDELLERAGNLLAVIGSHFDPAARPSFKVGDPVIIARKFESCARIAWLDEMDDTIGDVGRITDVDDDGDIRLSGQSYAYAPESIDLLLAA